MDKLVTISNPLDINPSADDEAHSEIVRALTYDGAVDAIVVGLDPLSPAMHTLEKTQISAFSMDADNGIVRLLSEVVNNSDVPVIAVVDGGRLYDPFRDALLAKGIPTFPVCDRAVTSLSLYIESRLYAESIRAGITP